MTPAGRPGPRPRRAGQLAVEDTGPGSSRRGLATRSSASTSYDRYGRERAVGTGLGLAIVKELAQGMGGRSRVESDPGRATRFELRLGRRLPEPALQPA